ncbi:uncharacterized protein GGS22DRAFT_164660 [Annulohypoxylon maeteangense]|uniref:uncharacterized protein n=1 Tax=Annulohypoxylon maeteangense TaxID=1927788 RepID=UPI0020079269|nr:uncharacterized protein GGS22DRAFT_164660 [Annulohypoxylon maeteangense]KAI0884921.1 hypothetical protein GGS22DRAFT_164660 [Annulohypoxylon maeteangense]
MRRWLSKTKRHLLPKNSRTCCLECKMRKIQCNRKRPSCGNCESEDRACCFEDQYTLLEEQSPATRSSIDLRFISKLLKPPTTAKTWPPIRDSGDSQHLSLFHHVETSESDRMVAIQPMEPLVQAHITSALSTSYLMNQLLAFSTQHLNSLYPDQNRAYHNPKI